jgi:hypothetical protein
LPSLDTVRVHVGTCGGALGAFAFVSRRLISAASCSA